MFSKIEKRSNLSLLADMPHKSYDEFSRREFLKSVGGFVLVGCLLEQGNPIHPDASDYRPAYEDFLTVLSDEKYGVYSVSQWQSSYRPDRINILLRHDADFDNGIGMVLLDLYNGIRSTTYLRLYADEYKIEGVRNFYQIAEKVGFEIGLHQEDVDRIFAKDGVENVVSRIRSDSSIPNDDKEILIEIIRGAGYNPTDKIEDELEEVLVTDDVIRLFKSDLESLRKYFDARSVSEHGGNWNYLLEMSPRWAALSKECNVFSASQIPFAGTADFHYLSDAGTKFANSKLEYFKEELAKMKPGDIAEINVHPYPPRWQYKTYPSNYTIAVDTTIVTETGTSTRIEASTETKTLVQTETQTLTKRTPPNMNEIDLGIGLFSVPIALVALALYKLHNRNNTAKKS